MYSTSALRTTSSRCGSLLRRSKGGRIWIVRNICSFQQRDRYPSAQDRTMLNSTNEDSAIEEAVLEASKKANNKNPIFSDDDDDVFLTNFSQFINLALFYFTRTLCVVACETVWHFISAISIFMSSKNECDMIWKNCFLKTYQLF